MGGTIQLNFHQNFILWYISNKTVVHIIFKQDNVELLLKSLRYDTTKNLCYFEGYLNVN